MVVHVNTPPDCKLVGRSITLRGMVQGLGVRPTVARCARSLGLVGSVRNGQDGVRINVVGEERSIATLLGQLRDEVTSDLVLEVQDLVKPSRIPTSFEILASDAEGPTRTSVPVDRKVCDDCLAEMESPSNRRFGYPFISCTQCGPRYSILDSMPYDRRRTSMARFRMCDRCNAEYEDPKDRRFHSQTNCCADCGPRWWSIDNGTGAIWQGTQALDRAAAVIRQGGLLSLKGIGGYQLICDATNERAIGRLREAKQRPRKPLAVMVGNLAQATELARISPVEQVALQSAAGPIVLARSRSDSTLADLLCRFVSPGLADLGVMLPTTPLHHWLCSRLGVPLVVTSGNLEGEPLIYQAQQADHRLGAIADLQLHHDREIVRPVDDSVVRCIGGRMVTLRAGRGLAPLTIPITASSAALATGGHQKVAIALCNGHQAILGPHVGELEHTATRVRYAEQTEALCQLYDCDPCRIVHDLHPEYYSTRAARDRLQCSATPDESFTPGKLPSLVAMQHHHAHVVAAMAELGWLDRTVLGIAMDGTGLGPDGTIWGGEVLRASATRFERLGQLRPFRLAGGEAAIRDPARVAIALIADAIGIDALQTCNHLSIDSAKLRSLLAVLSKTTWSPITSSVGRLFDGVATIVLNDSDCSYEGEPAMRLEAICDQTDALEYSLPISSDAPVQLDWRPMIHQLLTDRDAGVAAGAMAMRFHRGLAKAIVSLTNRFSDLPVVLCGGVFQNRVLVELIVSQLPDEREIGLPSKIPLNDGGLAAGQLAAMLHAEEERSSSCV